MSFSTAEHILQAKIKEIIGLAKNLKIICWKNISEEEHWSLMG